MRLKHFPVLITIGVAVFLSACALIPGRIPAGMEALDSSIIYAAELRTFRVLIPASYDGTHPLPLVLVLHGGGGEGRMMCSLRSGIQEFAMEQVFIVVCPDGIEKHWNDGRELTRWRAHVDKIDDVGFLRALIDQMLLEFNIDSGRIYATGVSNGGKMSLRLACEATDLIAGVAAVIASLPADLECLPSKPVSILLMNGTEDPLVPYSGGQVHFLRQDLGTALSTPETVKFWVNANHCNRTPAEEFLQDLEPNDGTRIRREIYSECDANTQVVLYEVHGGGHTWPGGSQYVPEFLIGKVSKDAVAGELIWSFFKSIPSISVAK